LDFLCLVPVQKIHLHTHTCSYETHLYQNIPTLISTKPEEKIPKRHQRSTYKRYTSTSLVFTSLTSHNLAKLSHCFEFYLQTLFDWTNDAQICMWRSILHNFIFIIQNPHTFTDFSLFIINKGPSLPMYKKNLTFYFCWHERYPQTRAFRMAFKISLHSNKAINRTTCKEFVIHTNKDRWIKSSSACRIQFSMFSQVVTII